MTTTRRCGVCGDRPARVDLTRVPLCHDCYGTHVVVRTAATERFGGRTFYVRSFRATTVDYIVKRSPLGRWLCTCPDYVHRGHPLVEPCKHIRLIKLLARVAQGLRYVPAGTTMGFELRELEPTMHAVLAKRREARS